MKQIVSILILLFCLSSVNAQETIEKKRNRQKNYNQIVTISGRNSYRSNGGFLGLNTRYGKMNEIDAIQIGAKAGWIAGHFLAVGIEGHAFVNDYRYDLRLDDDYNLSGAYGGFFIEPIILPRFPVHISLPVHFGIGQIGYGNNTFNESFSEDWHQKLEAIDNFLLIEPGVELEINLVKFCRLGFGVYYRYTTDIDLRYQSGMTLTSTDVLNGLTGGFSLKFGKF